MTFTARGMLLRSGAYHHGLLGSVYPLHHQAVPAALRDSRAGSRLSPSTEIFGNHTPLWPSSGDTSVSRHSMCDRECSTRSTRHPCARCPRPQPEERFPGPAQGFPDRFHGTERIGQVLAGIRHHLRRGAATLRRVPVRLRPPVPGTDGQAGLRLHRGSLTRGLHRPEIHLPEPAIHGRHHHGGLRLPASPVRPHRHPALPGV